MVIKLSIEGQSCGTGWSRAHEQECVLETSVFGCREMWTKMDRPASDRYLRPTLKRH